MTSSAEKLIPRTIAYIDGFNLFFGLRQAKLKQCYWLNVCMLASELAVGSQLIATKYFTSRIAGAYAEDAPDVAKEAEEKRKRQSDYLEALCTLPNLHLYEGIYKPRRIKCFQCEQTWRTHEEKMTDVNIATELLTDVFLDRIDQAVIVSGDSDLSPPMKRIRELFPDKQIVVAFPPRRVTNRLLQTATKTVNITEKMLRHCQLPDELQKPDGFVLRRPEQWR